MSGLPRTRIDERFEALARKGRAGFVAFVTAGDPDPELSLDIVRGIAGAGADLIELGMPFSDPMADGPAVQESSLRALRSGMTLGKTLELVAEFRKTDDTTPIILMGYFNPIHHYGVEEFLDGAVQAGVDGLIMVDLPPEEDEDLCLPALSAGLNFVRLAAPTTDESRLPAVLENASGFLYYISIVGVTGAASPGIDSVRSAVERIRKHTEMPIAVGFGINTPEQAGQIAEIADAAVVGSAICRIIAEGVSEGAEPAGIRDRVMKFVADLARGVHAVRKAAKVKS